LTLIRIFEELRGRGYDGGYDAVRRYARRWAKRAVDPCYRRRQVRHDHEPFLIRHFG
jgi:hypothetical protein